MHAGKERCTMDDMRNRSGSNWGARLFLVLFVLMLVALAGAQADCKARGGEWVSARNATGRWAMACSK